MLIKLDYGDRRIKIILSFGVKVLVGVFQSHGICLELQHMTLTHSPIR